MTDSKRRLLGMGIPLGLAFVSDTALTMCGNPPFEIGDRFFFHILYLIHPFAVIGGYVAWAGIVLGLLLLLPELLAVILTITVVFGHVGGAYSQLTAFLGRWWYQAANGLFLVTAVTLGIGLWWSAQTSSTVERAVSGNRLPAWLRCGLIALLLGAATCLLLLPWRA